jgi:uncharacterized membrane protein YdjX (TVP38/TMEM64 family)
MTAESFKQRIAATRNLGRVMIYFRVLVLSAILITITLWLDYWIRGELGIAEKFLTYAQGEWGRSVLAGGGIVYILLLSLPFVPGVELGILLMCVFGKEGIVFVYLATIAGLSLAFLIGRLIPQRWIDTGLKWLGNSRSCSSQSDEIETLAECMSHGRKHFPPWLRLYLVKYRYFAIAILVNLPGNYIVGGGGGISIACGTSRRISWKGFFLTIVLAVSPVPILAYLGILQLEILFGI